MESTDSYRSTGLPALDLFLGGGWKAGALSELRGKPGGGKTELAIRSAARLTKVGKLVAVVTCGKSLFPPAFASADVDLHHVLWLSPEKPERSLWATDQVVRSGLFPLVITHNLLWEEKAARRLQLAAEKSGISVLLLRSNERVSALWPVFLSVEIERRSTDRLLLHVLRSRKLLPKLTCEVSLDPTTNLSDPFPEISSARVAS